MKTEEKIIMIPLPKTLFGLLTLENFRLRTAMYIGENKISILRAFIDGYFYALDANQLSLKENDHFHNFHDWVANHFGWYESTAGWCNIILQECNGDETNAVSVFFELYDKFTQQQQL